MATSEETHAGATGTETTSLQDSRETTQAPRYADWISYAVAVTQQAQPSGADYSSDSQF